MSNTDIRKVFFYKITIYKDDLVNLSTNFYECFENKILKTGLNKILNEVNNEAFINFLECDENYIFGIVSSNRDMDPLTEIYDKLTHKILDNKTTSLSYFTYFVINLKTMKMLIIQKRSVPNPARILTIFFKKVLALKLSILNDLVDDWKDRLKKLKNINIIFSLEDNEKTKKTLLKLDEINKFIQIGQKVSIDIKFNKATEELIQSLEEIRYNKFRTFE